MVETAKFFIRQQWGSHRFCRLAALLVVFTSSAFIGVSAGAEPLLWKVEAKSGGADATVYLFGSIHFGTDAMYPLPERVSRAFSDSPYLAVEADVLAQDPVQTMGVLQRYGLYGDGSTLDDAIDSETWSRLETVADQLSLPVATFRPMRPWFVALQLTSFQLLQAQLRQELGIDYHFLQRAREQKTILELESIESQLQIFAELSAEEEVFFLRQTLDDFNLGPEYLQQLSDAWNQGDQETLESLVLDSFADSASGRKLYRKVFVDRNRAMLAALESYLRDGKTVFYVVGIGHMIGPDGLVATLRERGYEVTLE